MAKNLNTYMPGILSPEKLLHGFELFTTYSSEGGDIHLTSPYRNQEYGRGRTRFHLKCSMCDIRVSSVGGGEGGAGFCCCMQGSPGYNGAVQRYSVCCHMGNSGQAGTQRCNEFIVMCIGAGGCVCSTCTGQESCMSTMHHCNRDGTSYFCVCSGGPSGGSINNCNWGYNNDADRANRALGGCWNSICCYGANCQDPKGACRSAETGTKTSTDLGWDCNYCFGCMHSGHNMYKSQCCSDGRCGVHSMSSGPNLTSPFQMGEHTYRMGNPCQQEHSGIWGGYCDMMMDFGMNGDDVAHFRMRGRSTSPGAGCAGGCKCGSPGTPGISFIRWKDPDMIQNGHG